MDNRGEVGREERREGIREWVIISGLALLFLIYGLFMFLVVGDKGPPGWDFGAVEDIPGRSVYSTQPGAPGRVPDPEAQHVSERPLDLERRKK